MQKQVRNVCLHWVYTVCIVSTCGIFMDYLYRDTWSIVVSERSVNGYFIIRWVLKVEVVSLHGKEGFGMVWATGSFLHRASVQMFRASVLSICLSIWLRRALVIYFCLIDVQIEAKPADARPWHRPWFGLVRRMKVYTFSYGAIPFGYETAWNHALNTFRTKRLPSRWACQYLLTRGTFRIRDRPFQCVADVGRMIRFLAIHTKFRI